MVRTKLAFRIKVAGSVRGLLGQANRLDSQDQAWTAARLSPNLSIKQAPTKKAQLTRNKCRVFRIRHHQVISVTHAAPISSKRVFGIHKQS